MPLRALLLNAVCAGLRGAAGLAPPPPPHSAAGDLFQPPVFGGAALRHEHARPATCAWVHGSLPVTLLILRGGRVASDGTPTRSSRGAPARGTACWPLWSRFLRPPRFSLSSWLGRSRGAGGWSRWWWGRGGGAATLGDRALVPAGRLRPHATFSSPAARRREWDKDQCAKRRRLSTSGLHAHEGGQSGEMCSEWLNSTKRQQLGEDICVLALRLPSRECGEALRRLKKYVIRIPKIKAIINDAPSARDAHAGGNGTEEGGEKKLVLIQPEAGAGGKQFDEGGSGVGIPEEVRAFAAEKGGEVVPWKVRIAYEQLNAVQALKKMLPPHLEIPSAFEQVAIPIAMTMPFTITIPSTSTITITIPNPITFTIPSAFEQVAIPIAMTMPFTITIPSTSTITIPIPIAMTMPFTITIPSTSTSTFISRSR